MQLYTSYFARYTHVLGAVSIARWEPSGVVLPRILKLAPSKDLLYGFKLGKIPEEEYTCLYLEQLETLTIAGVEALLEDGMTLLCWEGPGKFCHRHILAKWLRKHGHTVTERL